MAVRRLHPDQPHSFSFNAENLAWARETIAKYPAGNPMRDHILEVVRRKVQAGSIVLSHDAGGQRSGTLAAYEILLPELKQKFQLAAL